MRSQVLEVHLDRTDYAAGVSAIMDELARLDTARSRMLFARLGVSIVTMAAVIFLFPYSIPGLLTACLLIWLGDLLAQSAFRTQTVGVSFEPAAHGRFRVEFSDDGIVENSALRTRSWTWDAVRRVHLSSGYVIVELQGWDMIVLPNRLWPTADERQAFLAELDSRRLSGETRSATPSAGEAAARVMQVEPVLIARICLAVAAFELIFEAQLPFATGADRTPAFLGVAIALAGAALLWWVSGKAFAWLSDRSPTAALRTARALFLLLAGLFALWCFQLI